MRNSLSQQRVCEALSYDPDTGVFTWASKVGKKIHVGDVAGFVRADGYIHIGIDGYQHMAHRLAWLYTFGEFPCQQIDHINNIKTDNRLANLRLASNAENQQNVLQQRNNTSGYTGVTWHKQRGKWAAQIMVNRKCIFLGLFDTPEEAHNVRLEAKQRLHTFAPTAVPLPATEA